MTAMFAWAVHLYTAMGLVCAAGMAVAIVRGGNAGFRAAFALMMLATIIDATDGWFARKARVKEVLPRFDGRALDDLIDFHTYTSLPLLLLWRTQVLPGAAGLILLLPLLASAYGFSQVNAKTDDGFFLGFPSYWNIIAFYIYVLRPPASTTAFVLLFFAALTFIPTRYLYASQGGPFALVINGGAVIWLAMLLTVVMNEPPRSLLIAKLSLFYPAAYLGLSWITHRAHARAAPAPGGASRSR